MKLLYESKYEAIEDIQKAEKQAEKILNELKMYINSEPIQIKIDLEIYPQGFGINGKLLMGENLVKDYNCIDLLFLDLENLMFETLLKNQNIK